MLGQVAGQSTFVIGVLAFVWSYLLCGAIFVAVVFAARRGHSAVFKAVSPVTLTPLAVIFGLLVGFLAADVWPNFERARAAVGQEAMALRQTLIFANALPAQERQAVQRAVQEHIARAVDEEWPAMVAGSRGETRSADRLSRLLTALAADDASDGPGRAAREHTVAAVERAIDAQRQRLLISETSVSGVKWFVFVLLAGLLAFTIAMIHADDRRTQLITILIFATAVGGSAMLIMAYDRPFGGGGISVTPAALQDVLKP